MTQCSRCFVMLIGLWLALSIVGCGRPKPAHEPSERGHEAEDPHRTIHLAQATQQVLGIAVAAAKVKPLEQTLEVTGQVAQDTDRIVHVNAPETGTVKELLVTIGQHVEPQQPLAVLISTKSPELLQVLGPKAGFILGVHVTSNAAVDPLTCLMTIADLSQVWATFDVYEQDVALVQVGQRMEVQSVAYSDRVFLGQVVFVSPQVDPHTRTIKVRAQIENPDYALKLGMFVTGTLYVPTEQDALVVPQDAIQRIEEEVVVFVQAGSEVFESREIQLGKETRTEAQILDGLQAGESVVTSGSFHLKAEILKATLEEGHAH